MMRVIRQDDLAMMTLTAAAGLGLLGAAIGAIIYLMIRVPALMPVWPAIGMGIAIGAMDRTSGQTRRQWAWVAVVSGVLACAAILAT